jgi:four helix bundle protein
MANIEIMKQVIRSSGSVGANYIEANEALSKIDFAMRIKICRKEAKESSYWLLLIVVNGEETEKKRQFLIDESTELMKIFGSIVEKVKSALVIWTWILFRIWSSVFRILRVAGNQDVYCILITGMASCHKSSSR